MFAKTLVVLATISAAFAVPTGSSPACNTGTLECCDSVQPASSLSDNPLFGILELVLQNLNVPIGVTCTPINIIGAGGGGNCNANPVCCTGNTFGSLSIGCTPVNLNL